MPARRKFGPQNRSRTPHYRTGRGTLVFATSLLAVQPGCGDQSTEAHASDAAALLATPAIKLDQVLAMQIGAAGHGKVFDRTNKEMQIDLRKNNELQASIRKAALESLGGQLSRELKELEPEQELLLADRNTSAAAKLVLNGGWSWRLLQDAPEDVRKELEWRLETLNAGAAAGLPQLDPKYARFLRKIGYSDFDKRFPRQPLTYAGACDSAQVPLPPDWSESGTAWVFQGSLSHNMLDPGGDAYVWTYSDPGKRGGCIALPRDTGDEASPLGIICQSAVTGQACFWDNILRGTTPERAIGWRGRTLRISELKDGSNLSSACTRCHRGSNVFLIAPDDPTWARVLRGTMAGAAAGTFTTKVETSTDVRDGRPRYIPNSGWFARPGWVNEYLAPAGCTGCHESPTAVSNPPPMPPVCGANCYRP